MVLGHTLSIPDDRARHLVFGPLDLWIRRRPGEWHFACSHDAESEDRPLAWSEADAPDGIDWQRHITGDTSNALVLRPLLPDRPLVVRPEMPVRLHPGQATDFFVGIPLWIDIEEPSGGSMNRLFECPSIRLSNTWFGTPQEGELCYSMRTHAHRTPDSLMARTHRCICQLQVKNNSQELLSFERICLRGEYLHVYQGDSRFWTNAVRFSYRGRQEWSRVIYGRNPPESSGAINVVSFPRKRLARGADLHSFQVTNRLKGMV